jgi:hypothetical protein
MGKARDIGRRTDDDELTTTGCTNGRVGSGVRSGRVVEVYNISLRGDVSGGCRPRYRRTAHRAARGVGGIGSPNEGEEGGERAGGGGSPI